MASARSTIPYFYLTVCLGGRTLEMSLLGGRREGSVGAPRSTIAVTLSESDLRLNLCVEGRVAERDPVTIWARRYRSSIKCPRILHARRKP